MKIFKNYFRFKNQLSISLSLFILTIGIVFTIFCEKQNLKTIDESFSSIYADRLIPATDIFFITDQLYDRRLKLQSFLLSTEENPSAVNIKNLEEQNRFVDSLFSKYQGTFLVESEVVCLKNLTRKWEKYKAYEENILNMALHNDNSEAYLLFNTTDGELFKSIIKDLHLLTQIQSQVGEDLMDTSKTSISSTYSIFALQFAIIIMILSIIIKSLFIASRFIKIPEQKFHLN